MSEVAEDYPSDTGDDRFAGGGKPRQFELPCEQLDSVDCRVLRYRLRTAASDTPFLHSLCVSPHNISAHMTVYQAPPAEGL